MDTITVQSFRQMILNGARELVNFEKELNSINVFPVADGDTGSNMAYLMRTIMMELSNQTEQGIKQLKLACLRGSRGNSGMILSQFIISMCDYFTSRENVNMKQFVEMSEQSVNKAVEVVRNPVEGTILTVMRDWVKGIKQHAQAATTLLQMLEQSREDAYRSLEKTKLQMPLLKKHNVVDAGAKGFYYFIQGFTETMSREDAASIDIEKEQQKIASEFASFELNDTIHEHVEGELVYRYCTEFLFEQCHDLEKLKSELAVLGDSMVYVGDEQIAKIHIHTNHPEQIAALINEYASISFQKVEDMQRQNDMIYKRKHNVAIVVDSACDLPQDLMDRYHIHLLPLVITVEDSSFLDKRTLTPAQLYGHVQSGESQIRTSLPSREAIRHMYEQLLQHYHLVVSIHLSEQLSGTYNACLQIANELDSQSIVVLDSKSLSGAYGLHVLNLAQQLDQHMATSTSASNLVETVDWIKEKHFDLVQRHEILVTVPSLKSMVRSGRVSPMKGKLASLFNIQPIVSVDEHGASKLLTPSILRRSNIPRMLQQIKKIHIQNEILQYVVLYTDRNDEVMNLIKEMHRLTGKLPEYVTTVSSVIGIYAGSGAYSIAMTLANKNERGYM